MSIDVPSLLKTKALYRFTGPPEHWLTAIKFMTWGLEMDLENRWKQIKPGDIFFIHSTANSYFKNAKSGIIGLGVIGPDFSIKKNPLWLYETINNINRWPLLVPLSEIYLFSPLPLPDDWNNPSKQNIESTKYLIGTLLKNSIPLSQISGFPQMGSFSSVKPEVASQILNDRRPLYQYTSKEDFEEFKLLDDGSSVIMDGNRKFEEVKNVDEALS